MRRFAFVWLTRLSTDRMLRERRNASLSQADAQAEPLFAAVMAQQGGYRLTAVTAAAESHGLYPGLLLTDARAICPDLKTEPADPVADARRLHRLARWCERYTPLTALAPPDGIVLDITGCAHLFGGEQSLLEDAARRMGAGGFSVRTAIADTVGAAHAVARFSSSRLKVVGEQKARDALTTLPIHALRIDRQQTAKLEQLGLKTIGALYGFPRASLTARFGRRVVERLDQALGHTDEVLTFLAPAPDYRAQISYAEPIVLTGQVLETVKRLAEGLSGQLKEHGVGARRLVLSLFRIDGVATTIEARASTGANDADHLARLFTERINGLNGDVDHGEGIETLVLSAFETERRMPHQRTMGGHGAGAAEPEDIGRLLDRIANRLGFDAVTVPLPAASHVPERAERYQSILALKPKKPSAITLSNSPNGEERPFFLLPVPEPITVMARVPDGPPLWFRWRRVRYQVVRAEGPERITSEWWRKGQEDVPSRDYYRLEDIDGRRFWAFRLGLYECETNAPTWYLQGLFG